MVMAKQDIRDLDYDKKLLEDNLADALQIAEDALKNAENDEAIWLTM